MEYFRECHIEAEGISIKRPLNIDHPEPLDLVKHKHVENLDKQKTAPNSSSFFFDIQIMHSNQDTCSVVVEVRSSWSPLV